MRVTSILNLYWDTCHFCEATRISASSRWAHSLCSDTHLGYYTGEPGMFIAPDLPRASHRGDGVTTLVSGLGYINRQ